MEKRVTFTAGRVKQKHSAPTPKPTPSPELASGPGTYIIQFPKEQIYRVPPPENALIVEQHREQKPTKKATFPPWLLKLLVFVLVFILILGIIVALFYAIVQPRSPKFYVHRVSVKKPGSQHGDARSRRHHRHHHQFPQYVITLKAENPNKRMDIFYLKGGHATLSFRKSQIATGKPPTFYLRTKNSTTFRLVLTGSDVVLPYEIKKNMNDHESKKEKRKKKKNKKQSGIELSLSINLPKKKEIGLLQSWTTNEAVAYAIGSFVVLIL
ncbi:PREDICTED: uncharacterized protein LOC104606021 [Nelumbo nucifera]|uniref:Uncharacterized protein LOC104606021 n=1 Tax=Nelumbo nucifera TaxID=4432 RepID=A0A1U8ASG6_NELNU|nr:PREDICTED: uncharacterized protein LOC104606021 [Nelumbo nucifera]